MYNKSEKTGLVPGEAESCMQEKLKIAYSGAEGAFAHIAAGRIFPESELVPYGDFKAAYNSVAENECDAAVLPIENSFAGEVGQSIDLMFFGDLYVNGIYELKVQQNLLGISGASLKDIKTVTSHPQAISQCYGYIEKNGFKTKEACNTAVAAKTVAELNDPTLGAIASKETAKLYGLEIIESNINESSENVTRFAVISKIQEYKKEFTSTVLMLSVKHEAGTLAKAIGIIGEYGYNMTALRSRPMRRESWQYYFYIEIDGSVMGENGKEMMNELRKFCDKLKVVGTFTPGKELK